MGKGICALHLDKLIRKVVQDFQSPFQNEKHPFIFTRFNLTKVLYTAPNIIAIKHLNKQALILQ
jgi:hypothetical protein